MPSCDFCEVDGITRTCSYCGLRYCPEHALPENHKCLDIFQSESHGPDFRPHEQDLLATEGGGHCRGCGKAIKSERKWCFQCATQVEPPSAEESGDPSLDLNKSEGGANTCIECGRATGVTYDRCFLCRASSTDSTRKDQQDKGVIEKITPAFKRLSPKYFLPGRYTASIMRSRGGYELPWQSGLILGIAAFVSGFLLSFYFVTLGPVPKPNFEVSNQTMAAWYYYNGQQVTLAEQITAFGESARVGGYNFLNDATIPYYDIIPLFPVLVLLPGGMLAAARWGKTRTLGYAAMNGASIFIGYGVAAVVGALVFRRRVSGFGVSGQIGPDIFQTIVWAGVIYPVVIGAIGGLLFFLAQGGVSIHVRTK